MFILAVTTPNVVHTGNPVWVKQSDQTNSSLLSLGGGPLRGNNYTIDGVSMTDLRNRSVIIPVFEAVQEMKVQTNTYDAEMGRTGGGVFNTIHRRGTNDWAGSVLYQFRPGELNTFWRKLAYFQQQDFESGLLRQQDLENAPYNLFGGSFGGPLSAGRTFFWLAAEGYSDHAIGNTTVTVPTPAEASGDFSRSRNVIYDPFSLTADGRRPAFANGQIPASSKDPAGSSLADFLATLGPGGQISTSGIQIVRAIQTTGNLSHAFNDRWHLSGTYLHYQSTEPLFGHYQDLLNSDTRPVFGIGSSTLGRDVHAVAINTTVLPTANSVFTVRYGQTYFNDSWSNPAFGKDQFGAQLGIRGDFLDKLYAQEGFDGQFPKILVADFGNNGNALGGTSNTDVQWLSREISGTYGQFVGNHTLKWGGQWRRLGLHTANFGNGMVLRFAKKFTQGPDPAHPATGSGSALADLLLGIPDGGSATLAAPADLFLDYFGGFFQDDWRVSPDLVLNLGLRVEHETGLREDSDDFAVGWDRRSAFPLQVDLPPSLEGRLPGFPLRGGLMYAGLDGNPAHQWNPPAAKLGPRVGFAYSLNASTVIRGGFAVFWAPYAIPSGTGASETGTYGYTAVTDVEASIDGITPSESTASNPFPHGILDPVGNANGRLQNIGGDVYFNDQHRDSPYIKKWSLDLQREIGREGRRQDRLRGQSRNEPADRRDLRLGCQHQPARGQRPVSGRQAQRTPPESLLRRCPLRIVCRRADPAARPVAATVPALPQRLRPSRECGGVDVPRASIRIGTALRARLGRTAELHAHKAPRQHLRGKHLAGEPDQFGLQHAGRVFSGQVPRAGVRLFAVTATCAALDEPELHVPDERELQTPVRLVGFHGHDLAQRFSARHYAERESAQCLRLQPPAPPERRNRRRGRPGPQSGPVRDCEGRRADRWPATEPGAAHHRRCPQSGAGELGRSSGEGRSDPRKYQPISEVRIYKPIESSQLAWAKDSLRIGYIRQHPRNPRISQNVPDADQDRLLTRSTRDTGPPTCWPQHQDRRVGSAQPGWIRTPAPRSGTFPSKCRRAAPLEAAGTARGGPG